MNMPIRKPNGTWAKTDKDKAYTFANHLCEVFQPHQREVSAEEEEDIHEVINAPYQMAPPIKIFKKSEVEEVIDNLENKKSPGYDIISSLVLKIYPTKV